MAGRPRVLDPGDRLQHEVAALRLMWRLGCAIVRPETGREAALEPRFGPHNRLGAPAG